MATNPLSEEAVAQNFRVEIKQNSKELRLLTCLNAQQRRDDLSLNPDSSCLSMHHRRSTFQSHQ